jgi:hypothetical protein
MPQTPHLEQYFTGSEIVREIVTGMSDGRTVLFRPYRASSLWTDQIYFKMIR